MSPDLLFSPATTFTAGVAAAAMVRPPELRLSSILQLLFLMILCFPFSSRSELASVPDTDLARQVEEMKLKVASLESVLGRTVEDLKEKDNYLFGKERQLTEIENRISSMERSLNDAKRLEGELAVCERRITQLEEEVQLLWEASSRSNSEIQMLEKKLIESDQRLKELKSEAMNMGDIITEQWRQIQHLEHALQIAQVRARNQRWKFTLVKCSFLKTWKDMYARHRKGLVRNPVFSYLSSNLSHLYSQLMRILLAAKKYHHELQGSIMELMEKNELTAPLISDELVFFLASALITFPVIGAWIMCNSFLS